jgi:hypothetical protein
MEIIKQRSVAGGWDRHLHAQGVTRFVQIFETMQAFLHKGSSQGNQSTGGLGFYRSLSIFEGRLDLGSIFVMQRLQQLENLKIVG